MIRSNSKKAIDALKAHVLDFYPDVEVLKADLKAVLPFGNVYGRACALVDGGCFLCYYSDVCKFLNETLERNEQPSEKSWLVYKRLIGLTVERILNQKGRM